MVLLASTANGAASWFPNRSTHCGDRISCHGRSADGAGDRGPRGAWSSGLAYAVMALLMADDLQAVG